MAGSGRKPTWSSRSSASASRCSSRAWLPARRCRPITGRPGRARSATQPRPRGLPGGTISPCSRQAQTTPTTPRPASAARTAGSLKAPRIGVDQVDGGDRGLAAGQRLKPIQAAAAAQRQAAAGLPDGPVEQRVMAAGQDRGRGDAALDARRVGLAGQPALQQGAGEEPFAAELRRRHPALPRQVVEGAFGEASQAAASRRVRTSGIGRQISAGLRPAVKRRRHCCRRLPAASARA